MKTGVKEWKQISHKMNLGLQSNYCVNPVLWDPNKPFLRHLEGSPFTHSGWHRTPHGSQKKFRSFAPETISRPSPFPPGFCLGPGDPQQQAFTGHLLATRKKLNLLGGLPDRKKILRRCADGYGAFNGIFHWFYSKKTTKNCKMGF